MPSKKPSKAPKKTVKTAPKKAVPKAAPAKKATRPPVAPKAAMSAAKPAPKTKAAASKTPTHKAAKPKPPAGKADSMSAAALAEAQIDGSHKFDIRPLVGTTGAPSLEEEADGESGAASLLAGPRNVKPYIARRGEQYMNKVQLEHFAQILQNWKRDLMVEVDRTVLHMKDEAANFPDPNDRATQEEEFSLELRTRDRERKLIRKIDEALKRIEDGSYGYCLETGEEIGIKRLEARPVATLSVEAQERRERREKQYGDRDDRYR